jgi:hypothetical protein
LRAAIANNHGRIASGSRRSGYARSAEIIASWKTSSARSVPARPAQKRSSAGPWTSTTCSNGGKLTSLGPYVTGKREMHPSAGMPAAVRGQAGGFSANCGTASPISCHGALNATWRWKLGSRLRSRINPAATK